ncbi:MAG: hypothetical protein ACTSPV_16650 [Candidatus Hodarchaeales archaeon]
MGKRLSLLKRKVLSASRGGGICQLCYHNAIKLERHHLNYVPEITIDICHDCHFKSHFQPQLLSRTQKGKILSRVLTNRQMMEAEKDIDKSYRQRMGWLSRMRAIKEGTYKY